MQTGGRMHVTMNRLQYDIQLQGCQHGHMLPEHPKTMWPVAEDIVRSPDVSAWKSALYDGLRSADGFHVLSVDGTMKIAMGVRRRDAGTPLTSGGSQQDHHVDYNTCVLTARTLQGAVLDTAVVPSDSKPHVVVSALENAVLPDDRVGVHWAVVDNASPALHAALSWSFPSLRGERNRQFTGDEVFFYDRLCRVSLSREHKDAAVTSMKSAEVWSGLAVVDPGPGGCRDSLPRRDEKQAFLEGEVCGCWLMAAATFQRYQWYLGQCTTPLDGGVPAGGPAGHRDTR